MYFSMNERLGIIHLAKLGKNLSLKKIYKLEILDIIPSQIITVTGNGKLSCTLSFMGIL